MFRSEGSVRDLRQFRRVHQLVGSGGDLGGEADIVGEPLAVDPGVGVVEDGRGVPTVERAGDELRLRPDEFGFRRGQGHLVDRATQRGVAVGADVGAQGVEFVETEHPLVESVTLQP